MVPPHCHLPGPPQTIWEPSAGRQPSHLCAHHQKERNSGPCTSGLEIHPRRQLTAGLGGGVRLRVEVCVREHMCAGFTAGSHGPTRRPPSLWPLSLPWVPHPAGVCRGGGQID